MKKIIFVLLFAMAGLLFAGVQSVSAQSYWEVEVNWTDECGGCPSPGGYEYYVCCTITDICDPLIEYHDCQIKSSGVYTHTFSVGEICDIDQHEACFVVEVSLIKRCIIGHYEICSAYDRQTVNCATISEGMPFILSLEE